MLTSVVTSSGKLIQGRIQRLEEIGFIWDPRTHQWEEGFSYLKKYQEEHGDCRVNTSSKYKTYNLGAWVAQQRVSYRKDLLDKERVQKLDKLGFIWDTNN